MKRRSRRSFFSWKNFLKYLTLFCLFIVNLTYISSAERRVTKKSVGPGSVFTHILDEDQELNIFLLTVDLQNKYIGIETVLAHDVMPERESVPAMSRRYDRPRHRIVGAINADFFVGSLPRGLMVKDGNILKSGHHWSSMAFSKDKVPLIDIFTVEMKLTDDQGNGIKISAVNRLRRSNRPVLFTAFYGETTLDRNEGKAFLLNPIKNLIPGFGSAGMTVVEECLLPKNNLIPDGRWVLSGGTGYLDKLENLKPGKYLDINVKIRPDSLKIHNAVSGGPRILRAGIISVEREKEGQRPGFDTELHPRSAIGYSRDKRFLVLAVVDGRRSGYSKGIDLYDLAGLMKEFGCFEALNLDGGGSSTLVIRNQVINRPSDPTGPRLLANALLIVSTAPEE